MTGYTDQTTTCQQGSNTGYGAAEHANTPGATTQPGAAQGGYLGKASAWTGRITNNLTSQAEGVKGKLMGGGQTSAPGTTGASNTTYTPGATAPPNTAYPNTGTGGLSDTSYRSHNVTAPTTGHSAQTGSGYAPADASASHGHGAKGASYTDQAKDWTSRIATNLTGQAEYLKNKVAGPSTTTGATGVPQDTTRHTAPPNPQGSYDTTPAGYGAAAGTNAQHGTHQTGQAGQSWTDKAKQGLVASLDYTQQGLEWTKNKVAGPTSTGTGTTGGATAGTTGTTAGGTAGMSGTTGHHTAGTHHQAGNTNFPPAPGGGNMGFGSGNTGFTSPLGSGNTGFTSAPGSGNSGYTSAPGTGNTGYNSGAPGTGSQY